eukprot:gene4393-14519_t
MLSFSSARQALLCLGLLGTIVIFEGVYYSRFDHHKQVLSLWESIQKSCANNPTARYLNLCTSDDITDLSSAWTVNEAASNLDTCSDSSWDAAESIRPINSSSQHNVERGDELGLFLSGLSAEDGSVINADDHVPVLDEVDVGGVDEVSDEQDTDEPSSAEYYEQLAEVLYMAVNQDPVPSADPADAWLSSSVASMWEASYKQVEAARGFLARENLVDDLRKGGATFLETAPHLSRDGAQAAWKLVHSDEFKDEVKSGFMWVAYLVRERAVDEWIAIYKLVSSGELPGMIKSGVLRVASMLEVQAKAELELVKSLANSLSRLTMDDVSSALQRVSSAMHQASSAAHHHLRTALQASKEFVSQAHKQNKSAQVQSDTEAEVHDPVAQAVDSGSNADPRDATPEPIAEVPLVVDGTYEAPVEVAQVVDGVPEVAVEASVVVDGASEVFVEVAQVMSEAAVEAPVLVDGVSEPIAEVPVVMDGASVDEVSVEVAQVEGDIPTAGAEATQAVGEVPGVEEQGEDSDPSDTAAEVMSGAGDATLEESTTGEATASQHEHVISYLKEAEVDAAVDAPANVGLADSAYAGMADVADIADVAEAVVDSPSLEGLDSANVVDTGMVVLGFPGSVLASILSAYIDSDKPSLDADLNWHEALLLAGNDTIHGVACGIIVAIVCVTVMIGIALFGKAAPGVSKAAPAVVASNELDVESPWWIRVLGDVTAAVVAVGTPTPARSQHPTQSQDDFSLDQNINADLVADPVQAPEPPAGLLMSLGNALNSAGKATTAVAKQLRSAMKIKQPVVEAGDDDAKDQDSARLQFDGALAQEGGKEAKALTPGKVVSLNIRRHSSIPAPMSPIVQSEAGGRSLRLTPGRSARKKKAKGLTQGKVVGINRCRHSSIPAPLSPMVKSKAGGRSLRLTPKRSAREVAGPDSLDQGNNDAINEADAPREKGRRENFRRSAKGSKSMGPV